MLQAAFGGYRNTGGDDTFTDAPNVYREPSFDIMFPLELTSPKSQKIYILLRIRTNNAGTTFEAGTGAPGNRFTVSATNSTTGDILTASVALNTLNTNWNESSFSPYVLTVDSDTAENNQIDVIDCIIRDANTNAAITFRINVLDSQSAFNSLTIVNGDEHIRPVSSTLSSNAVLTLSRNGLYSILSPIVSFQESASGDADFSYPDNIIFYKREQPVNDEIFEFSISDFSPAVVSENIMVYPLPSFRKAAVLVTDGKLQDELKLLREVGWVDITATGKISGVENVFRVYLKPQIGGINVRSL